MPSDTQTPDADRYLAAALKALDKGPLSFPDLASAIFPLDRHKRNDAYKWTAWIAGTLIQRGDVRIDGTDYHRTGGAT